MRMNALAKKRVKTWHKIRNSVEIDEWERMRWRTEEEMGWKYISILEREKIKMEQYQEEEK